MARNPVGATWPVGSRIAVREYPIKASATWLDGALLKLTSGELEESGADPATIVGIACFPVSSAGVASLKSGYANVYIADTQAEWRWAVTGGTPVPGVNYGVVKSTTWFADIAETTAVVLRCTRLDPNDTAYAYFKFTNLTIVLQG